MRARLFRRTRTLSHLCEAPTPTLAPDLTFTWFPSLEESPDASLLEMTCFGLAPLGPKTAAKSSSHRSARALRPCGGFRPRAAIRNDWRWVVTTRYSLRFLGRDTASRT